MDGTACGGWLKVSDVPAARQRAERRAILDGRPLEEEVAAALEERLAAERIAPRCRRVGWCAGGGPAGCGGCTAGAAAEPEAR